jgi:hypothetical protein
MAAALVTKKHALMHKEDVFDPTSAELPPDDDCWLVGELARQVSTQVGMAWQKRLVKISHEHLCFGKTGQRALIDFIPLTQITRVRVLGDNGDKSSENVDDDDEEFPFVIETDPLGQSSGKSFILSAGNSDNTNKWVVAVEKAKQAAVEAEISRNEVTCFQKYRRLTGQMYNTNLAQYVVALVILASYITALVTAQILPKEGSSEAFILYTAEAVFTGIFAIELAVNLFGNPSCICA